MLQIVWHCLQCLPFLTTSRSTLDKYFLSAEGHDTQSEIDSSNGPITFVYFVTPCSKSAGSAVKCCNLSHAVSEAERGSEKPPLVVSFMR